MRSFYNCHLVFEEEEIRSEDVRSVQSFASGELEYEESVATSVASHVVDSLDSNLICRPSTKSIRLVLAFTIYVISGTCSTVFMKLQAIALYNYPNFTNLFSCFLFIPLCFLYIIPMIHFGESITSEQQSISKHHFAIMGALDCLSTLMQTFSAVYLPGSLLVLLPQACIPLSMLFSRKLLNKQYQWMQYFGSFVVILGILVVLEPELSHRHAPDFICEAINLEDDCSICRIEETEDGCMSHISNSNSQDPNLFATYVSMASNDTANEENRVCSWIPESAASSERWLTLSWSLVLILSCIPLTLSTIYKEALLSSEGKGVNAIYLSGWIVNFQTIYAAILAAPAGMAMSPPVYPQDLLQHLKDGWKCYLHGIGSIDTGCHPDDDCGEAAFYFNICLIFSLIYVLSMMAVIKWGSTSLLFLGTTLMVPFSNVAFCSMGTPFHVSDLIGLIVILAGLLLYSISENETKYEQQNQDVEVPTAPASNNYDNSQLIEPLLSQRAGAYV